MISYRIKIFQVQPHQVIGCEFVACPDTHAANAKAADYARIAARRWQLNPGRVVWTVEAIDTTRHRYVPVAGGRLSDAPTSGQGGRAR